MRLIAGMQYRAAAWAGVATQFFWGGIELFIYAAFYRSGASIPDNFDYRQLASLIWLRQAFLSLVMLWSQDNDLADLIIKGDVAYELCRPLRLYTLWYARLLALRLSRAALRCLPILIVAFFLPEPYCFYLPPTPQAAILFLAALILAVLIVVALSMFIYLLTFITMTMRGTALLFSTVGEFLMGALIPIPLMPEGLQRALSFLPFRYTADFPFRVYSGSIAGFEAYSGLGIQMLWAALLVALGRWGFAAIQKRLLIQGG
jgi:ABC-2 type transport system permease protein